MKKRNQLETGMEFKNLRALCNYLGLKYEKPLIKYHRVGHKIVIDEIVEKCIPMF